MFATLAPVTPAHPAFTGATLLTALAMVAVVLGALALLLRSTCRVDGCHVTREAPTERELEARRREHYLSDHYAEPIACADCRMGRHPERPHRLHSSREQCGCACAQPRRDDMRVSRLDRLDGIGATVRDTLTTNRRSAGGAQ